MRDRVFRINITLLIAVIALFAYSNALGTAWFLSPSFPNEGGKGFEQDLLDEFGGEAALTASKVVDRWKMVQPDDKGYLDLLKHLTPADDRVAYAVSAFEVESDGIAWWRFGSDDGVKVWVNGKPVTSFSGRRGSQKDSDECLTPVTAGMNSVLLKIDNGTGAWGFYFRLAGSFPRAEGKSACIVSLTLPPILLYGSQYPIEQWATANILNNGTQPVEGAVLQLQTDGGALGEMPIPALNLLSRIEGRFRVRAPSPVTQASSPASSFALREKQTSSTEARIVLNGESIGGAEFPPIALRRVHPLLAGRKDDDGILRFIHATDTHIVQEDSVLNDVRTADNLKSLVKGINAMGPQPDFVMVTGDLVLDSAPGLEYFGELMKPLRAPWLAIPGNHDKPGGEETVLRLFGRNGFPLYYSFDYAGYHLVALDGQPPSGSPVAGGIIPEQIEWLQRDLKLAREKETIIFVHQHPLITAIGETNRARGLVDWPELTSVLESFPKVKWLFCGHAHADYFAIHNGIRYIMTTATAYQFSPGDVPYFANEAGVRLTEFNNGKASSRFLRVDGTWRDDPPVMESPEFSPRAPEPAGAAK